MAFNNTANTIVIKKGASTPPDNYLWLRTSASGTVQGLYKNIGEDTWVPYDVGGGNPDLDAINQRIQENSDRINDLSNNKQDILKISNLDNILSLNGDTLHSELELVYIPEDKAIYLRGRDGKIINKVPVDDFINDGLLENVEYDSKNKILKLIFNTDHDQKVPIEIDLNDLVDVYTAGKGLKLENGKFSIDEDVVALTTSLANVTESLNSKIVQIEKDYKDADSKILESINKTSINWTNFN